MADGSITISTELDNKGLERQLLRARREIEKLEQVAADHGTKKSPLVLQAQELEQKMRSARAEVKKYGLEWQAGIAGADKNQTTAVMSAQQLELQHAGVVAQIEKIDSKLAPAYEKLDKMKESAGGLELQLSGARENCVQMAPAVLRAEKSMNKFKSRLKEVVRSALIFTVITQGLAKFRAWVGDIIKTNEETTAAVARLKGALLTLAQPLVDVVIPAFTTFVNILAELAGMVASVMATMFGSTAKESAAAAENLYNEQEAINGVGNAAKKAGKSMAKFDTVDKISEDKQTKEIVPDFSRVGDVSWLKDTLGDAAGYVAQAILLGGIAFVAIGACTGNLPLVVAGLIAIGYGAVNMDKNGTLQSWVDTLRLNNVQEFVLVALTLAGIALVAIGAATGDILLVLAGLGIIWMGIAYAQSSGMMDSWTENQVSKAATYITAALLLGGIALVAIGAATANILMVMAGLGLLAASVYVGAKSGALQSWADALGLESVFDYVVVAIQLAGIALIAIGACMANIIMVIAGATILSAGVGAEVIGEETLNSWWDVLKLTNIQQWVSAALLLVGVALIAIGACMANILMIMAGFALIAVGGVVGIENGNLEDWVKTLGLEKVVGWVSAALMLAGMAFVVFGIFTANVLMVVAGIGLLLAGFAVGTASGTFKSWVETLHLEEVSGWVSVALVLGGIALVAIGAMTLNPLLVIAGLGLLGAGAVVGGAKMSGGRSAAAASIPTYQSRAAMPSITSYDIPELARGAVIPPNREFLAVLGDQKSGTNIEAPASEIEAAVDRALDRRGGTGGGQNTTVVRFEGSLSQLARVLKPHIETETNRSGGRLVKGGAY